MTHQLMKTLAVHGDGGYGVPRYSHFDYTDISPFFFGAAQETYRSHGKRMRFKTLNIELDPEPQGFECGTYDLLIAAAVRVTHAGLISHGNRKLTDKAGFTRYFRLDIDTKALSEAFEAVSNPTF